MLFNNKLLVVDPRLVGLIARVVGAFDVGAFEADVGELLLEGVGDLVSSLNRAEEVGGCEGIVVTSFLDTGLAVVCVKEPSLTSPPIIALLRSDSKNRHSLRM